MKGFLSFIGHFFGVILAIVFYFYLLGFATSMITRSYLSEGAIKDFFAKVDVLELEIGSVVGDVNTSSDPNSTIKNYIKDYLTNEGTPNDLNNQIVESKTIKDVTATYLEALILNNLDIKGKINLNSSEIIKDFRSENINMDTDAELKLTNSINDLNKSFKSSIIKLPNDVKEVFTFVNKDIFIVYTIIVFITFYLLISLCVWSFYKPMLFLGIPLTLSSIILILPRAVTSFVGVLFNVGEYGELFNTALKALTRPMLIYGIIYFVVGIGFVILYSSIRKKITRRKNIQIIENDIRKSQKEVIAK